jgi:hypothetical protein
MKLQGTTADGKTVEVEVNGVVAEADLSTKYVPKEAVQTIVQDRLTQFAQGHVKLDDISTKPELKERVLSLLGIKSQSGDGSDVGKQLEGAKKQWTETELKPVIEREQAAKTEIESLRRDRLTDSIVAAAARAGVKGTLLNPPFPGSKPPIVAMLEQGFGFEDKTRQWYAKGAAADQPFAFSAKPTGSQPYKAVEEAVLDWARKPENKEFIGVTTQSGPGLGGGSVNTGGVGFISTADARDPRKYRIAKEAAQKAGVELQLTD